MIKATHIENDGTYWLLENNTWYFWRNRWGWSQYVGKVNDAFLANKTLLSFMHA